MTSERARELRNAYARGYNAARRGYWPQNYPVMPPDEFQALVLSALIDLHNYIDNLRAVGYFDGDDERKANTYLDIAEDAIEQWNNRLSHDDVVQEVTDANSTRRVRRGWPQDRSADR